MIDEGKTAEEQATSTEVETKATELSEETRKLIQSEVDRVRTKYVQEKKELEAKLKELEQSKLSDEEKRQQELAEKESLITQKEQEILKRELTLTAFNALTEKNIPTGFAEFVVCESEEATQERIDKLVKLWNDAKSGVVEGINRELGRKPAESKEGEHYTKDQLRVMTPEQIMKLPKEVIERSLKGG